MEHESSRWLIMGLPSLVNLSICGSFADGWTTSER